MRHMSFLDMCSQRIVKREFRPVACIFWRKYAIMRLCLSMRLAGLRRKMQRRRLRLEPPGYVSCPGGCRKTEARFSHLLRPAIGCDKLLLLFTVDFQKRMAMNTNKRLLLWWLNIDGFHYRINFQLQGGRMSCGECYND